jgi:Flp pilus assembly protein TadG
MEGFAMTFVVDFFAPLRRKACNAIRLGAGFGRDRSGTISVMFGLLSLAMATASGSVLDFSRLYDTHQKVQDAMDAAVLAGLRASNSNQSSTATSYFNGEMQGSSATLSNLKFTPNGDGSLSGTVTATIPTLFLGLAHITTLTTNAQSTATPTTTSSANKVCVLLVDPSATQELTANSGAKLNASGCEVDVKSTANPAAVFNSGITLTTTKICIQGTQIIDNGGTHPNTVKGCSTASDPFAGHMPAPPHTSCDFSNGNYNGGTVNLTPGVYCGWFNFNSGPTVTFAPGVYVIQGGGWNVNGGVWTGNGVTFYYTDTSHIQFNSGINATLSAPTSGTYNGILFYEAAGLSKSQWAFDDSKGNNLTGLMYLPSRQVTYNSGSSVNGDALTMVFDTLILDSTTWNLKSAPTTIAGGATTVQSGVYLKS